MAEHLEESEKREKKKFLKNKLRALCFSLLWTLVLFQTHSYVSGCLFSLLLFKKHIKGEKQITDWVANGSLNGGKKVYERDKKKSTSDIWRKGWGENTISKFKHGSLE